MMETIIFIVMPLRGIYKCSGKRMMIYDVLAYKKENGTIPRYQIQMDVGGN